MADLSALPWAADADGSVYAVDRAGRKSVGIMVSGGLADEVADLHNAALAARRAQEGAARRGVTRMTGLTGVQLGDGNTQNNVF